MQEYFASLLLAHVKLTEAEAGDSSVQHLQRALDGFFEDSRLHSQQKQHSSKKAGIALYTMTKPAPSLPSEAEVSV